MKGLRWLAAAMAAASLMPTMAQAAPARFDWFDYRGTDDVPAVPAGSYRNPVIAGYYPDPSMVRVGEDYYLVNSSFSWFPGIPVWHSRDLVHWRQIGNAIDRADQLDFARLGMSRGVFAPAISYHDGRFYIVNTCVDCGGNFVITATNPAGPWSAPHWLKDVGGIDPSLFFDDDGSAWLVNNDAPVGTPRYSGHRAIWLRRFDPATLTTSGPARVIVDGGVNPADKPVWIEGPHLFKKDGSYYLSAAEGGTSTNHSQVIFRSPSLDAPFVPAPAGINPILTQRDLDPARANPITSSGHADMVALPNGQWWAVFLATRPYQGNLYNTGRETFLLPVTWKDGWPTILPPGNAIPHVAPVPPLAPFAAPPTTGSFADRDEFAGTTLGLRWITMRVPVPGSWAMSGGALVLTPGDGIGDHGHPSLWAHRQQHARMSVSTALRFAPAEGERAGLAAVQDDDHFLALSLTRAGGKLQVVLARRDSAADPATGRQVAAAPLTLKPGAPLYLRLEADGGRYAAAYATRAGQWRVLARDVDGTNLSTEKAGGFTGAMVGVYAAR